MVLQHTLTITAYSVYYAQLVCLPIMVGWSDQSSQIQITLHCIIPIAFRLTNIL